MSSQPPKDYWLWRRRLVFGVAAFSLAGISYLALFGEDSGVVAAAVQWLGTALIACVGGYITGSVFDDNNMVKAKGKRK